MVFTWALSPIFMSLLKKQSLPRTTQRLFLKERRPVCSVRVHLSIANITEGGQIHGVAVLLIVVNMMHRKFSITFCLRHAAQLALVAIPPADLLFEFRVEGPCVGFATDATTPARTLVA